MDSSEVRLSIPAGMDYALLCGTNDCILRRIEELFNARVSMREDQIVVRGNGADLPVICGLVTDLMDMASQGNAPTVEDVQAGADVLRGSKYAPAMLREDVLLTYRGKAIRPKTAGQKRYVDAIRNNTVTFGIGPAGTGKTYLAMAMAIAALKRKEIGRIILTRPVVEAGESLGYLPGSLTEKVDPYVRPLYDALFDMTDMEKANSLLDQGVIEIAPLAFMRGRTFNDAFLILDEAQNTTPEQMKMFLTRLGFGSKMVITGDITQLDLPHGVSGLRDVRSVLDGLEDIEFCELTGADVVRHSLVAHIVSAYDEAAKKKEAERVAKKAQREAAAKKENGAL